ncbi:MAG: PASTA domain-containing protein [Mycobacteriales bacterium]
MRWPDASGRGDDDAPTLPGVAPVRAEEPELLGIPGLDYMPRPENGPPPVMGVHRRDRPRPPWIWFTPVAALAVLAALAFAWTLAGTTDRPRRPPASASGTDSLAPAVPPATMGPLPTVPGASAVSSPVPSAALPSPTAAAPPAPSASTMVSPTASPRVRLARVPDVVGDRQGAAEATLRAAGFAVAVELVPAPSPRQARRVLAQGPGSGQLARLGSVVTLTVGDRDADRQGSVVGSAGRRP